MTLTITILSRFGSVLNLFFDRILLFFSFSETIALVSMETRVVYGSFCELKCHVFNLNLRNLVLSALNQLGDC